MKKLLVGSVFINDSPIQEKWLDLQLKYLKATTEDFDHVVVLSQGKTGDNFSNKTNILLPTEPQFGESEEHFYGLNLLHNYFIERKNDYENFLFLDADAFPFKNNWMRCLLMKMKESPRTCSNTGMVLGVKAKWKNYDIAAALRCENLEKRLHASIMFVKNHALRNFVFKLGVVGSDLAGNPESDIYIENYQNEMRDLAFPLIRTNKNNVNHLACGIYYDMFYHHACGSGRNFNLRAADFYMKDIMLPLQNVNLFTEQLMQKPNQFIKNLAGWNPRQYAVIDFE
jgi:hypothetical protein